MSRRRPTARRSTAADAPTARAAPANGSDVVHRNIELLMKVRQREEQRLTTSDRIAGVVTAFAGSMWSAYAHAILFGTWIAINLGLVPGVPRFDPTFVALAMVASVEAIFLSTFILIAQNRMQRVADRRAELDLQISLLTEHELTRAIRMIDELAARLGEPLTPDPELDEIKRDVYPHHVAAQIEHAERRAEESPPAGGKPRT